MAASTNIHGFNIGGNNNSFDQRGHFYRAFLDGNVSGMLVKQNTTPDMTVLVEHGSALLDKNTISASIAEIKSDTSVTIDTANTSNPRIDSVVIYEDTSVAIPTVEANYWQDGAGGRFKIVSLPGTAGAVPVALSDANIQTAIGAGKPWTRLADITVPDNSTTILNSNIADKRKIISPNVSNYGTAGVLTTDASGNVSATGAWSSWSPTLTNLTIGNGTVLAKYSRVGSIVYFNIHITLGSTSSVGTDPTISLPIASNSTTYPTNTSPNMQYNFIGTGFIRAGSSLTAAYPSIDGLTGNSNIRAMFNTSATGVGSVGPAAPGTWTGGSRLQLSGSYEIA